MLAVSRVDKGSSSLAAGAATAASVANLIYLLAIRWLRLVQHNDSKTSETPVESGVLGLANGVIKLPDSFISVRYRISF